MWKLQFFHLACGKVVQLFFPFTDLYCVSEIKSQGFELVSLCIYNSLIHAACVNPLKTYSIYFKQNVRVCLF